MNGDFWQALFLVFSRHLASYSFLRQTFLCLNLPINLLSSVASLTKWCAGELIATALPCCIIATLVYSERRSCIRRLLEHIIMWCPTKSKLDFKLWRGYNHLAVLWYTHVSRDRQKSVMATGDVRGNLERMRIQLRSISYPHVLDTEGCSHCHPFSV